MSAMFPTPGDLESAIKTNSSSYSDPVLLNIGAGPDNHTEGWLTLDFAETGWGSFDSGLPDVNWDLTRGIPFGNSSVAGIYASHILEHFTWFEGIEFLKECQRVLKPSAPLRIIVPDGDYFIDRFINKDSEFFHDPARCYNHWLGNITDTFLWNILGAFKDKARDFGRHAMLYNFENLSFRLGELGFRDIMRQDFNISNHSIFSDEYKLFPNGQLPREFAYSSLIIESVK